MGLAKQGGRRNLVSSGLPVARWPWAVLHWGASEWAKSFDLPQPLQFGRVVMVREKDWQLLNAFDPRMKQGVYLGPEDVDSVSAGHLVLLQTGSIARATTIHPSDEPVKGLVEAAAKLGWLSDKTPDGHFFWRQQKGERRWTDPTLQVWVSSRDPDNRQFWTHAETQRKTWEEPYIFEAQWRQEIRMLQTERKQLPSAGRRPPQPLRPRERNRKFHLC